MVPVKFRVSNNDDISELEDLYNSVIGYSLNYEDDEVNYLNEKYSLNWISRTVNSQEAYFIVALYMGGIVAAARVESNSITGLVVSKHYQNQGIENDLWEFTKAHLANTGVFESLDAEIIAHFSKNLRNGLLQKYQSLDLNYPHLFERIKCEAYKKEELSKAKKFVRLHESSNRAIKHFAVNVLILAIVWTFIFLDGPRVIFNPDKALESAAYKTLANKPHRFGRSKANLNYSEWKIDFLLWRGASPIYKRKEYDCAGAFSVAYMWYNPKLIKHLTLYMTSQDKKELVERCEELIASYSEERQQKLFLDLEI